MKRFKNLFSDVGTDIPSIIMIIWDMLVSLLVVPGIFKIALAISTGEIDLNNIRLY